MNTIKTILVPYDFSDVSANALDYTIDFIGMDSSIKIILVHITEKDNFETIETAYSLVKNNKTKFRGAMELLIRKGSLNQVLLDVQRQEKVDLVIMGTSGDAGEYMLNVNNTAKFAVEIDNCAVIAVPTEPTEFSISKIALVLGKSRIQDRSVLETLLRVTRRFNAQVVVLTIQNEEGVYGYSENDESNERVLEYYLESFYSHHAFIENSDFIEGVNHYVAQNDIDMVAILPFKHAKHNVRSKGMLTKELTMNSKVPVLVID